MKSFLRKISLFIILTLFAYIISINLLEAILPEIYKPNLLYQEGDGLVLKKMQESINLKNPDILFLGSSHAYRSFDPKLFEESGITSYNWGTSQQTHPQTGMVIREYVSELKPKLVVYEVFPEIFAMTGRESMADFLNAGKPFDVSFLDISQFDNSIALINTYLIKYSRKSLGLENKPKPMNPGVSYYKGFVVNKDIYRGTQTINDLKWVPRENQIKAFEDNLAYLKKLGVPVLLVVAPYPFDYKNTAEIISYLESKEELLFYNKILFFEKNKDFSDFHHINYNGVQKLNRHLIDFIKRKQYLRDSR